MARKSFSRKIVRKIRKVLHRDEAENIIEKEFGDNKGNKTRLRFDFNPHPINKPTIELEYDYGDNK